MPLPFHTDNPSHHKLCLQDRNISGAFCHFGHEEGRPVVQQIPWFLLSRFYCLFFSGLTSLWRPNRPWQEQSHTIPHQGQLSNEKSWSSKRKGFWNFTLCRADIYHKHLYPILTWKVSIKSCVRDSAIWLLLAQPETGSVTGFDTHPVLKSPAPTASPGNPPCPTRVLPILWLYNKGASFTGALGRQKGLKEGSQDAS